MTEYIINTLVFLLVFKQVSEVPGSIPGWDVAKVFETWLFVVVNMNDSYYARKSSNRENDWIYY